MDKTNNLSESLLQSSESSMPSLSSSSYSSSDTGFFDSLKNINATTWLLIILILAFLGFNIFAYLAKGTQTITDIFGPLIDKIFGTSAAIAGQTVDVSAEGAKAVVGGTAGAIEGGLTAVQNVTPNGATAPSSVKGQSVNQPPINQQQVDVMQQSTLNKALNTAQTHQPQQQDYQANEASSSVNSAGKSGWCFIGDDRGFRSCAEVGVNDTCMSGDIFPSQEICMNPNLRA
jgi:hypothetical protein